MILGLNIVFWLLIISKSKTKIMKKITLIIGLLAVSFGYAQSFPLTFSEANQLLVGDECTTSLTTDAGNDVVEIVGGGSNYDNAQLVLALNLDLSDSANNTITFRIKPLTGSTSGQHLLKFEDAGEGDASVEVAFTTSGTDWQNISLDFDDDQGNNPGNYNKLVLFTDFNNTESDTYLVDDFVGGTNVTPPAELAIPSPTPSTPDGEVLSLFGDTGGFTNIWTNDYEFGEKTIVDTDPSTSVVNETIKMDFSVAGYGRGTNAVTDISAYNFLHFDYHSVAASQLRMILIENDGTVNEFFYEIPTQEAFVFDAWTSVDIPLTFFTNLGFSKDKFFQFKLGTSSNQETGIVYFDNIYFSVNQGTLSIADNELIALKSYPNPTQNRWTIATANSTISSIEVYNLLGKKVFSSTPNSREASIDSSTLDKGVYFAQVKTELGLGKLKLVKE